MDEREQLQGSVERLSSRSKWLSAARLGLFVVLIGGLLGDGATRWLVSGSSLVLFMFLVVWHDRIQRRQARTEGLLVLLEERDQRRRSRRGNRQAPERPESGTQVERGERIYAHEPRSFALGPGVVDDLQLLDGSRTLFGFLDVSSTLFGARRLRRLLEHPLLDAAEIRERQQLVAELAGHEDLRLGILETLLPLRKRDFRGVTGYLAAEPVFAHRVSLSLLAHILGSLPVVAILAASFFGLEYLGFAVLFGVVNMGIVGLFQKQSNPTRNRIVLFGPLLDALLEVSTHLEGTRFESTEGQRLAEAFRTRVHTFESLRRRVWWLGLHSYGALFELINFLTLFELRLLPGTERVLLDRRPDLEAGIGALGELEALLCLACALAEQDDFVQPELADASTAVVAASGIAHPLLEPNVAVRNSFEIGRDHQVMLVTGSNMAGKSTFLKAVGVNLVLAQAGGPVAAREFSLVPVTLFSDVNVRDSLDDGKSYFQVEVERVRQVIECAGGPEPVFAIFDELFRGTNSAERLAVSAAIVRYLRDRNVLLIVATHDLRLTELVTVDAEPGVANYHFEEHVVEDRMTFDYELREGPAQTRNAIRVLEVSGYPEMIVEEARGRILEG